MNSATTYTTTTNSPADTSALGAKLASTLRGGEVFELSSDLGGGKTVLARGLIHGLGYDGEVASPTFTISRIYKVRDGLEVHHFDFYRIGATDVVASELAEVAHDPNIITIVEWAGNAGDALPESRIKVEIEPTGDNDRKITVTSTNPKYQYVIEGLSE